MTKTTLRTALAGATLAALAAAGCSTSAPERPAYDVPDQVGEVDPARLVGVWKTTPLNPYPNQPEQETIIEYRADGTTTGTIDPGQAEAMAALGDVRFEMNARWRIVEGRVIHEDVTMEPLGDGLAAKLMSGMVNGAKRDLGGEADIRELDADRIVMLGTDGTAMRYDRVE